MIMHVKPKRASSALEWVTATRYKVGGSVVTPRFGGLLHSRAQGLRTGLDDGGGRRVLVRTGLSGDDSGCRRVKRG